MFKTTEKDPAWSIGSKLEKQFLHSPFMTWFLGVKDLTPVFVDVEAYTTAKVNITSLGRSEYLKQSKLNTIAVSIGFSEPEAFSNQSDELEQLKAMLSQLATEREYMFVAHHAAFDIDALNVFLDMPFPKNCWCTYLVQKRCYSPLHLYMSDYGSFSNRNFSLDGVASRLGLPEKFRKKAHAPNCSLEELIDYNKNDIVVLQQIFKRQMEGLNKNLYPSGYTQLNEWVRNYVDIQPEVINKEDDDEREYLMPTEDLVIQNFLIYLEENDYESAIECCPCDGGELVGAEAGSDVVIDFLAEHPEFDKFFDLLVDYVDEHFCGQLTNIFSNSAVQRDYERQMEEDLLERNSANA